MICGENCGVQDTKLISMGNEVLGGTPYFFCAFFRVGSFKTPPSYRITYHAGTKKHGFWHEIARFRHKKSIHDDLQWYPSMM